MSRPLSGLRVIDFTHVLAGPACSYFLGLMGAEVIKVESVAKGDAMRHRGGTDQDAAAAGMSTAYQTQGAGKSSIAVDLETATGLEVMERLLRSADVFVENHLPRTLDRLHLREDRTRRLNPRLIHCAMTGYGRGGDRENMPAYDVNIQAASGLMSLTGTRASGPTRTGAPVMDYSVALAAGFAICAALNDRHRTGRGSFIDVSMLETAFTLMSSTITDFMATGNTPTQRGNAANSRSPAAGSFPCKTGLLSLGVNEEPQFDALAEVLDRPEWKSDHRFATPASRKAYSTELEAELLDALSARSAEDWERLMSAAGVPAAMVRTLPESLGLNQVAERGYLRMLPDTDRRVPTLPFRFDGEDIPQLSSGAPALGQHTLETLGTLGFSADEIQHLLAEGVVGSPRHIGSETDL